MSDDNGGPSGGGFIASGSPPATAPDGSSRAEANRERALRLLEERRRAAGPGPAAGPPDGSAPSASSASGAPAGQAAAEGGAQGPEPQGRPNFRRSKRGYLDGYYEYNLSEIRDTKGGFMAVEADAQAEGPQGKEKARPVEKRLRTDPPVLLPLEDNPHCRHCRSINIDPVLHEHFKVDVCRACRDERPEKYSLLTKTECKEDYLLTESELRDEEVLPHWLRPNPHKSTWSNMMLYLREQVEEFAWKKWGGEEKLDEEFERRDSEKKAKKEKAHKDKMAELRRKTRTSTWVKKEAKHEHSFEVEEEGIEVCKLCGLTVEVDQF
ncbi:XPA protein C-terminus-domain-containing protein [Hyaloraphidium curvatum]|nr:XPA protein C-terminus-domain-containing protein [Hyaloraphidium curvatum]